MGAGVNCVYSIVSVVVCSKTIGHFDPPTKWGAEQSRVS